MFPQPIFLGVRVYNTCLFMLLLCSPFEHYFVKLVTSTSLRLKLLCNVTWPAMFLMLSLYNSWRLVRRQETEFRRALRFTVARAGKVERCRNTTNISMYFITGEPSCEKTKHPKRNFLWTIGLPWSNINLYLYRKLIFETNQPDSLLLMQRKIADRISDFLAFLILWIRSKISILWK